MNWIIFFLLCLTLHSSQTLPEKILNFDNGNNDHFVIDCSQIISSTDQLYILDSGDRVLKIFTPDLAFVRQIGIHGQGPGEFQFPDIFAITDRGIEVFDRIRGVLIIFDENGTFLNEIKLRPSFSAIFTKSGILLQDPLSVEPYSLFDREGKFIQKFGEQTLQGGLKNIASGLSITVISPTKNELLAIGRDGRTMSIYDLTNGALLRKLELDIHTRYALPSESFFDKDRGSLQVRYGMPIRSAHWVKDRVFLHVEDERNQENQLLVALDAKGRIDQIDHLPMDTSRVLKDRDQLFSFHADTSTLKILELEYL